MSDERGAESDPDPEAEETGGAAADEINGAAADGTGDSGTDELPAGTAEDDEELAAGLSDDGILLFFSALGCLLAATTAYTTGQPLAIAGFAVLAGIPALAGFLADVLTDFVPGNRLELLVGAAALLGALAAVPGRHYVNLATLVVAAALVLWRVVDVEYRGAER